MLRDAGWTQDATRWRSPRTGVTLTLPDAIKMENAYRVSIEEQQITQQVPAISDREVWLRAFCASLSSARHQTIDRCLADAREALRLFRAEFAHCK